MSEVTIARRPTDDVLPIVLVEAGPWSPPCRTELRRLADAMSNVAAAPLGR